MVVRNQRACIKPTKQSYLCFEYKTAAAPRYTHSIAINGETIIAGGGVAMTITA